MFANAVATAQQFTRPIVVSQVTRIGTCGSSVGTCIVVNSDGWILTAAHVLVSALQVGNEVTKHQSRETERERIEKLGLSKKERSKALRKLGKATDSDIIDYSIWCGRDGVALTDVWIKPAYDLAVARMEPFDAAWVTTYPSFKDFNGRRPRSGTSLCTLGYPFPTIQSTYDSVNGRFDVDVVGRLALFPIEGIMTREVYDADSEGSRRALFIERSNPGLKGQSGGPIIDMKGSVWAVQSQTQHFSLGFDPAIPGRKRSGSVHQFLNAGWGVCSVPQFMTHY